MNKDVKVFVSSGFKDSLDKSKLDLLVKQAGMSHIHIRDSSSKRWHLKKLSYHKTSNTALIYCEGFLNKNLSK